MEEKQVWVAYEHIDEGAYEPCGGVQMLGVFESEDAALQWVMEQMVSRPEGGYRINRRNQQDIEIVPVTMFFGTPISPDIRGSMTPRYGVKQPEYRVMVYDTEEQTGDGVCAVRGSDIGAMLRDYRLTVESFIYTGKWVAFQEWFPTLKKYMTTRMMQAGVDAKG